MGDKKSIGHLFHPLFMWIGILCVFILLCCNHASEPEKTDAKKSWPARFGFGRRATQKEISRLDMDVRPDGKGLPPGSGTVSYGAAIYSAKCVGCHGKTGTEGPYNVLVGVYGKKPSKGNKPEKTIGNYWPYATTLYDYINRTMPFTAPGSLKPDEVYSLTAFLLYKNSIIKESLVLNAKTLPDVEMPAKKDFVNDNRTGGPEIR